MAWLKVALKFGSLLLQSVNQNPKLLRLLLELGALIWIVVCCLTHCGSGNGGSGGKTDTVRTSTTELIYDSTWHTMLGDTIAYYEEQLRQRIWESPENNFSDAIDCSDSLAIAVATLDYCDEVLTKCDERYRLDYAIRSYADTILDDTLVLRYDVKVHGKLLTKPRFDYKVLIPERIVTNEVTITNTLGPRRKIYLGGGAGPVFDTGGPDFMAMQVSLRLGYTDMKDNSYGLRSSYMTLNLWAVEIEYTRSFAFGKRQVISKD